MTKRELIKLLSEKEAITEYESKTIVETFFEAMSDSLVSGVRVEVRGLCTFTVREYKSYTGRNPKTGRKRKIKPKKLPFFKCGSELKKRVDYDTNKL